MLALVAALLAFAAGLWHQSVFSLAVAFGLAGYIFVEKLRDEHVSNGRPASPTSCQSATFKRCSLPLSSGSNRQNHGEMRRSVSPLQRTVSPSSPLSIISYKLGPPDIAPCQEIWITPAENEWFVSVLAAIYDVQFFSITDRVRAETPAVPSSLSNERHRRISSALDDVRRYVREGSGDPEIEMESFTEPLDDVFIARAMVAFDFNVSKCKTFISGYRKWRREMSGGVVPPLRWMSMGFFLIPFEDYLGRPVLLVRARYFQKGISLDLATFGVRSAVDAAVTQQLQRRGEKMSRENPFEQYVLVFEAEGAGWKHFSLDVIKMMLRESESHYPDRLAQCFILRCNATVQAIWRVVSPLLHHRTQRKVKLVAPRDVATVMQQLVARENLPPMYGGSADPWPSPAEASEPADWVGRVAVKTFDRLGVQLEHPRRIRVSRLAAESEVLEVWMDSPSSPAGRQAAGRRRRTTLSTRVALLSSLSREANVPPGAPPWLRSPCGLATCFSFLASVPPAARCPQLFEKVLNQSFIAGDGSREQVLGFIHADDA